jgi:putative NIF3 family GTP cyclohydrolase 1 type 2
MTGFTTDRRRFGLGLLTGCGLAAAPALAAGELTPRRIVERIQRQCAAQGVAWHEPTVDTFKIGDPDRPVTGVVTSFMGTLDVMQRTVAAGANFIVSHEPIYYNHFDKTDDLQADPVYQAKVRYATLHGLIVWRFHDHWHQIKPEPMSSETIRLLGWQRWALPETQGFFRKFERPATTLADLANEIAVHLPSRSVRVIGRPDLPVTRVAQIGHGIDGLIGALGWADVAIGPEVREWDSGEYMRDAGLAGYPKGLIMIAHERGEESGLDLCRQWLAPLLPETRVTFLPAGEPFTLLA